MKFKREITTSERKQKDNIWNVFRCEDSALPFTQGGKKNWEQSGRWSRHKWENKVVDKLTLESKICQIYTYSLWTFKI